MQQGPAGFAPLALSCGIALFSPTVGKRGLGRSVGLYRRRLLTWRLQDGLPCQQPFPAATVNSGQAFAAMHRLLDEARSAPFYLRQPAIADMVVEAIQNNAANLEHYVLHAFMVMPNHVHLLATPALALPKLTKSWKVITSKRAKFV
jgi:hypothetical protein